MFDATNEIIRRITRYATQLSEKNALGANRKEEYRKAAEIFLRCDDVDTAHKMSAMVFGIGSPHHLAGDFVRETDSMNRGVYEEKPLDVRLKPRIRTYHEKMTRSAIRESSEQKHEMRLRIIERQRVEMEKLGMLETADEYKELLDLLIQLRTPKLSKDFKPSVINDILSDSLQALSDEDLRPMSEAIENMDTMNMNLKSRKEAKQAVDLFQLISAILFLCRNWLKYPLELYIVYSGGDPRERT